jgi:hypothetical protein
MKRHKWSDIKSRAKPETRTRIQAEAQRLSEDLHLSQVSEPKPSLTRRDGRDLSWEVESSGVRFRSRTAGRRPATRGRHSIWDRNVSASRTPRLNWDAGASVSIDTRYTTPGSRRSSVADLRHVTLTIPRQVAIPGSGRMDGVAGLGAFSLRRFAFAGECSADEPVTRDERLQSCHRCLS